MTRTAPRCSAANAVASARRSWARRERRPTDRPESTSGSTITGIATSTRPDSFGLDTTIMAMAPTNRNRLRSATEAEEPKVGLELGRVGGQARQQFAGLRRIVEAGVEPAQVGEEIAPEIGDDPLAERHDEKDSGWPTRSPGRPPRPACAAK